MHKQKYLELRNKLDLQKKWQPLITYFVVEAGLLLLAAFLWSQNFKYLVFPLVATVMFRNFSLMHDAVHGAIAKNKTVNDFIGAWCGGLCLLPFKHWKTSHLQHHLWSGNIEKDPVMALRVTLPKAPTGLLKALSFAWQAWIPSLATLQYALFWKLSLGHAMKSGTVKSWGEFILPVVGWAAAFAVAPDGFFLTALLPGLVLYMVAVEVVNFPHHLQLPMSKGDTRDPIWEQYKTSRTCLYPKWFAHHVVLNFNYHSEHHMFPDAPWYALESVHELVKNELQEKQNLDLNFKWTVENRPLSLLEVICPPEISAEPVRESA